MTRAVFAVRHTSAARRSRRSARIATLLLAALGVLSLFPLYWMFSGSFKLQSDVAAVPPSLVPLPPALDNWTRLIGNTNFSVWRWVANSLIVSLGTVAISVSISALCGFAFAKIHFAGSRALFLLVLATMMLPVQVMIVPLFLIVRWLGLFNTFPGLILPLAVYPFGIFLMRQFMARIPDELLEAAHVDGATQWQRFWHVALPLATPALAALAIFTFFAAWNNFMWQLIMTKNVEMMTLPVGVAQLAGNAIGSSRGIPDFGVLMAGGTFGAIPMLVFFLVFQRYFVQGIAAGALKG
jgi:multiple sugar transport system permease protein